MFGSSVTKLAMSGAVLFLVIHVASYLFINQPKPIPIAPEEAFQKCLNKLDKQGQQPDPNQIREIISALILDLSATGGEAATGELRVPYQELNKSHTSSTCETTPDKVRCSYSTSTSKTSSPALTIVYPTEPGTITTYLENGKECVFLQPQYPYYRCYDRNKAPSGNGLPARI